MDLKPPQGDGTALHLIALAACAPAPESATCPESTWLNALRVSLQTESVALSTLIDGWRKTPPPHDARLIALADALQLSTTEMLAIALACAAETDAMVGRVLAWLQAPVGGSRPTIGLIVTLAARFGETGGFAALAAGVARASGLIQFDAEARVLPEASLTVPLPIVFAIADPSSRLTPQGVRIVLDDPPALSPQLREAAHRRAGALRSGALAVRSGHPREARAAAAEIAGAMHARAAFLEGEPPPGFGPWLLLTGCVPVLCAELAPGERRRVPELPGWRGPWLVAAGPDGSFEWNGEGVASWRVPVPCAAERIELWHAATGEAQLAHTLGAAHRHAAGRIAELARAGRFQARVTGAERITPAEVSIAARTGVGGDLGTLAELLPEPIGDDALVLPSATRRQLEALARRCLAREALIEGLGPAAQARYRPGVRALFVGPSGTGKTLGVGWLATRLALPLYRVDLASITSKYIGETEKNLAQLFARAEHAEVVLLFDEADSLFGKRTDVKEANDRFANAQTNYLLSRIESYEGIAMLTSNSRARFDSAFTRRLDAIIDFPAPGPEERRALWVAHLGPSHALTASELNCLASACDLSGGHIRNVVLSAATDARTGGRSIAFHDVTEALDAEYRKLGKQTPHALGGTAAA